MYDELTRFYGTTCPIQTKEIREGIIAKELSRYIYHLSSLDGGDKGGNYSQGAVSIYIHHLSSLDKGDKGGNYS